MVDDGVEAIIGGDGGGLDDTVRGENRRPTRTIAATTHAPRQRPRCTITTRTPAEATGAPVD